MRRRLCKSELKRLKRLRYEAYMRQGGKCYYCKEHIFYLEGDSPDPMRCSAEHIIPVRLGGKTTSDNVVAVHQKCNSERNNLLLKGEWLAKKMLR